MRTFSIQTLGCRVNHYESEQIATLLRDRGYRQVEQGGDVRVVNTCSVTVEAAAKSRQITRRAGRVSLPVLPAAGHTSPPLSDEGLNRPRVIVTGCWATSDREAARQLPGVDAVVGHGDDVAGEITKFLEDYEAAGDPAESIAEGRPTRPIDAKPQSTPANKPRAEETVNENSAQACDSPHVKFGTMSLPLLGSRQAAHQRAFLKVQDGCDAHCTYCIIPQLRPALMSKSVEDAVEEAKALIDSGHRELVLTGIFLGAYGQPSALRRRQPSGVQPITHLIDALCTRVPGLARLRLSSIEPGDLTPDLIAALRAHPQVTPHFHLPLQSGSDRILRRMNRQYTRGDFLAMLDQLRDAFDRPALTTDVITGFPGETEDDFAQTLDVVDSAAFIHVHAFPFSPRPNTAAARWTSQFVPTPVAQARVATLRERAAQHSERFRRQFIDETVEVLVERFDDADGHNRHGRCERYFDVSFTDPTAAPGDAVQVRVTDVSSDETRGDRISHVCHGQVRMPVSSLRG